MGVKQLEVYQPPIDPRDADEQEAIYNYINVLSTKICYAQRGTSDRKTVNYRGCHRLDFHSGDHIEAGILGGPYKIHARWPNTLSPSGSKGRHQAKKCECGAASIGSPFHSSWCPLA